MSQPLRERPRGIKNSGKEGIKTLDLDGVIYDNEEAVQLMRRLPLEDNYTDQLTLSLQPGRSDCPVNSSQRAGEGDRFPAGTFDCLQSRIEYSPNILVFSRAHRLRS